MVTPKQMRPAQRYDILCVLVIESSQHMRGLFRGLYESVLTKVITQLRAPVIVGPAGEKGPTEKATPCVRFGVVFYGDYFPYSTQPCGTQYFTSNYREFAKTLKAHRFREGGQLRCAATEGLVAALEMFDDFDESDPEAHLTNVQQRHAIMVASTPPYAEACRENAHTRYDDFCLEDVARRMREMDISFSLIKERGKRLEQVEALLKTANASTKAPLEIPELMSPSFDARLMAIDLPIPPEFTAPPSAPASSTQLLPAAQPPVHIQPQPPTQGALPAPPQEQTPASMPVVPQKNKASSTASPAEAPAAPKKAKPDLQPVAGNVATAVAEATPKATRPKGKSKAGPGGRKAPAVSTSPAVAAGLTMTAAQAVNIPISGATSTTVAAAAGAVPPPPPPPPQQQQQQQQQQVMQHHQAALSQQSSSQSATNQAMLETIANNLRAQGVNSVDDIRTVMALLLRSYNPQLAEEEKADLLRQMNEVIERAKQRTSSGAVQAPAAAQMLTPQQQLQSTHVQLNASPAAQPAAQAPTPGNKLLQQAIVAVAAKAGVEMRQLVATMSPETFEASVREICQGQPEVLASLAMLKSSFAQVKSLHVMQMLQQQQQPQMASQVPQLASPNSGQAVPMPQSSGQAQQVRPPPASAAAVAAPMAQGQLWRGMLNWESRQGESTTHELSCQVSVYMYPGINYTAQGLRLNEWPDRLVVFKVCPIFAQLVER
ncbi:hypothetical protein LPJ61_003392, partial [Coemansia biformis]